MDQAIVEASRFKFHIDLSILVLHLLDVAEALLSHCGIARHSRSILQGCLELCTGYPFTHKHLIEAFYHIRGREDDALRHTIYNDLPQYRRPSQCRFIIQPASCIQHPPS